MKKLSFQTALPSQKRQGVAVAFEYIQWLVQERDISATTEGLVIRSLMQESASNLQLSVLIVYLTWQQSCGCPTFGSNLSIVSQCTIYTYCCRGTGVQHVAVFCGELITQHGNLLACKTLP